MINLIRKNGQTNVTAFQDVVLFDYALGGQNGVLKNVGNELALEAVTARQVRIKDGMAAIQGYQWEIESGSYETVELNTPPTGSTVVYYYLFAQIDLRDATNQKLTLVLQTAAAAFTNFPAGEDLKANPSGVAMLPLYTFEQTTSGVRNISRKCDLLPAGICKYASADISKGTIEERLTALGFKEGVVDLSYLPNYTLTRQGNYVIGQLHFLAPQGGLPTELCTLPINFRPKAKWTTNSATMTRQGLPGNVVVTIDTDGKVTQPNEIYLWIDVTLGFEAPPIL